MVSGGSPLCCVGRRPIWHGRWFDLSLWAGYKHGASLSSDARLSGHQRGVVSASGSLTGTGVWLMWVPVGRGVMVAGSGVGSDHGATTTPPTASTRHRC